VQPAQSAQVVPEPPKGALKANKWLYVCLSWRLQVGILLVKGRHVRVVRTVEGEMGAMEGSEPSNDFFHDKLSADSGGGVEAGDDTHSDGIPSRPLSFVAAADLPGTPRAESGMYAETSYTVQAVSGSLAGVRVEVPPDKSRPTLTPRLLARFARKDGDSGRFSPPIHALKKAKTMLKRSTIVPVAGKCNSAGQNGRPFVKDRALSDGNQSRYWENVHLTSGFR
jgi:hypothetical protein